jgi:hypothetical protein
MNRKNATVLFLSKFVTDYGKDNPYFNIKINNPQETVAYVLVLKRCHLLKMDRKNATVFIILFLSKFVTDYGKDNPYFNIKINNPQETVAYVLV